MWLVIWGTTVLLWTLNMTTAIRVNPNIGTIIRKKNVMINAATSLFSTNIPYMEHHFRELILAQRGLIFEITNAF